MIEEVKQYLLDKGFTTPEENVFELVQTQLQQMSINGQPIVQEHKRIVKLVYIGEGSIDEGVIYGFSLFFLIETCNISTHI
jgi:hypothetical protein